MKISKQLKRLSIFNLFIFWLLTLAIGIIACRLGYNAKVMYEETGIIYDCATDLIKVMLLIPVAAYTFCMTMYLTKIIGDLDYKVDINDVKKR